jgi:hypothetical protein
MDLTIPEPYTPDMGRILTEEERQAVEPTITPIDKVSSHSCKRESTNDSWQWGRRNV